MSLMTSLFFAIAAFFALLGTNAQAALARQQMVTDPDPLIREAVRRWAPIPRLSLPKTKAARRRIEADLREDSDAWARYQRLSQELWAWNALESSVALAFVAALWSAGSALISA